MAPSWSRMLFWPVLSTWMMAWPVLPADSSTNRVWTPARSSVSFRKCPSGPMRPACQVSTPARARATDWFSPLPPHWICRDWALMVSPGWTKWSTR